MIRSGLLLAHAYLGIGFFHHLLEISTAFTNESTDEFRGKLKFVYDVLVIGVSRRGRRWWRGAVRRVRPIVIPSTFRNARSARISDDDSIIGRRVAIYVNGILVDKRFRGRIWGRDLLAYALLRLRSTRLS